jgi:hypothetical protein
MEQGTHTMSLGARITAYSILIALECLILFGAPQLLESDARRRIF